MEIISIPPVIFTWPSESKINRPGKYQRIGRESPMYTAPAPECKCDTGAACRGKL